MRRKMLFKIIGISLIVIGIFFNPWVVEWLFSPDQKLDFLWKYIVIAILDIILIITGYIITKLTKQTIEKILKKIKTPKHKKTSKKKKILLTIATTIIIIIILESSFYILNLETNQKKYFTTKETYTEKDENLGYKSIPNKTTKQARIYLNEKIIFNVTYSIDEFGRRKNKHTEEPPLIIFGGSNTFGFGLEDNETLSHHLADITNYDLYNYGFPGYGTQHMLAILEQEEFYSEINKTGGKAIYIFTDSDLKRAIGNLKTTVWGKGRDFPYYYLNKDNNLQRKRNFKTGRPITTIIYRLLGKSNFIKYHHIDLPKHKEKHTYLTYKIIEKSKKIYEEKFNGTFYVLIHPLHNKDRNTLKLKELLQENNIKILEYNITNKNNYKEYRIKGDFHPNNKLNKELAEKIAPDINTK